MSFGFLGGPQGDPDEPFDMKGLFSQMGRIFASLSNDEGPIPTSLVRQTALDGLSEERSSMTRAELEEAFRLADLWLDEVTTIPALSPVVLAWTRKDWVERSAPMWVEAVTPIAQKMSGTLSESMNQMGPDVEAMGFGMAQIQPIIDRLGGAMFATQLGHAMAKLANEVLGSTDVGIAVAENGERALLPANVDAWVSELEVDKQEALLFLALREAAAVRLFSEHAWLKARVVAAIHDFAQGISIDVEGLQQQAERAMEQLQGSDPESLAEVAHIFEVTQTPEQQDALRRLETLLALIEGWIDHVVTRAASERLPGFIALAEMVRRRRAAGGPAEILFATLVGLELRPRRLRDAANLWAALEHHFEMTGRDETWSHPDSLPQHSDLEDPMAFIETQRLMRNIPDDLSSLE
jgi:putative hydrolase